MGTNPPAKTNTALSVKDRLEQVQRELAAQRRHTQRTTVLTVVVGLLLMLVMGGYFAYGYAKFKEVTEPEKLVNIVEVAIQDNLPEVRRSLEQQVATSAPEWAASLSKEALDSLPSARKKLEEVAMEQYDTSVEEMVKLSDEQFRTYLKANHAMLDKKFKELGQSPQLAEASLEELRTSLEDQLQTDMKSQASQLLDTLKAATAKLQRLRAGKSLTAEEQEERRVVMLARRLYLEETDPTRGGLPAETKPATGQKAVPDMKKETPAQGKKAAEKKTAPPAETKPGKKNGS